MNERRFFHERKGGRKWVVVTAYDTPTAEILEAAGVECVLVGDSVGMVLLGHASTLSVTMDEMIHHAKAVRRGVKKALLVGDLPFLGIRRGPAQALESARRFLEEAGCDAVKLEWGKNTPKILNALVRRKIPVMGHVGLTPQTAGPPARFKVQGRTAERAAEIFRQARFFEAQGAGSIVLECIPSAVARLITRRLSIPTIGIGAGPHCDGQVLVFQDLVGLFTRFVPRHVKHYAEARPLFENAVRAFAEEVRKGIFPDKHHSFEMEPEELKKLGSLR